MEAVEVKTGANVEAETRDVTAVVPMITKEEALRRVSEVSLNLRKMIVDVKKMPRDKTLEPHTDEMRCLSQAQNNLQTGLMWLRRAINPSKEF